MAVWPKIKAILRGQRLRPIWVLGGLLFVVFTLFRAGLLLAVVDTLRGVGPLTAAGCLLAGLRYDAVVVGFVLLPLALAVALAQNTTFARKGFRRFVVAYAAFTATFVVVMEIVGAVFFMHFGERLNWMTFDYFYKDVAVFLAGSYPVVYLTPVIVGAMLYIFHRLFKWSLWAGPAPDDAHWVRPVLALVLAAPLMLACHGGFDPFVKLPGRAYFTHNKAVTQLSLNHFYTMASAMFAHANLQEELDAPQTRSAGALAARMLHTPGDQAVEGGDNPLARVSPPARNFEGCNVVLILMEGMSGRPVGALGHSPSQTPRFDQLCREGLFFSRMYAVGARTSQGIVGTLCGHPDLGGTSLIKAPRRAGCLGMTMTLPNAFRQRDYRTAFIYGGNLEFDNMHEFLAARGMEEFTGREQMSGGSLSDWGVHDQTVLEKAHQQFLSWNDRPFFAMVLTVSNHEPYDVPTGVTPLLPADSEDNKRLNAYRYADWALGEFFRAARTAPYFQKTLFVLVADHGRDFDRERIVDVPGYRVPCLIYAPGMIEPGVVDTVCSQADLAATVLGLLGQPTRHCFMGRNVLNVPAGDGFAFMQSGDCMAFVRGDNALVLPPSQPASLYRIGPDDMTLVAPAQSASAAQLLKELRAFKTTSLRLYATGQYNPPE